MARSGFCIHGGPRRRLIAAAKELLDFPFQIRERTGGHRAARIDHDIPRLRQIREPGAHHFTHPPFEAVTDHGLAHRSGRSEAEARERTLSGEAKGRKERPAVAEAVVINFAEFARS